MDRAINNVEQFHENQEEIASAYHIGEWTDTISRVPSAITTATELLLVTKWLVRW